MDEIEQKASYYVERRSKVEGNQSILQYLHDVYDPFNILQNISPR